jgi:exodeoxyribonuclease V alpha subunit
MHFYRGSGAGAARYFDEGHQGAEAYYTEQERVAVAIDTWRAGERAGSTVLAEPGDLVMWVEGVDPATGEVKGVIRSGGADRQPLRFVEVVVNNPKSLSIVASQDPVVAEALDRTLARQADEIAKYLSSVAVTRIGPRGAQREVGGLTVETARVTHLTSREGDPHRHVHLMLNTRVKTRDGAWHGLHSAAIRQHIRAVNERASRVLITDMELRAVLGGEGYTLGADGEIDQARGAVDLLSKRTIVVAENRQRIEAEWREAYPGREPSQRVKNGWDQQAWAQGRPVKPYERETPEELSVRVGVELAEAGFDFSPGAHRQRISPDRAALSVGQVDRDRVAEDVVAVLSAHKSAWSAAELMATVEVRVTGTGVVGDAGAVSDLVEDVAARAAGRCRSVLDPEVHTPTSMSRYLTSEAVIDADVRLNLGFAGLAGGEGDRDGEGGRLAVLEGLDSGQVEAVQAVGGSRRLEVVVGPAGTGKTRMLAVAKQCLDGQGRDLVVVAPTRKAAQVAAAEIGAGDGSSLSKLVYDHGFRWDSLGRWGRLDVGEVDPVTGVTYRGPSDTVRLSGRSVVVVDEAGLLTVDQANALVDVVAESGAALRLVGDPRQLGAVGRGGVMESASRWAAETVTLDQVHRFLTVTADGVGLPVTEPDVSYAELSKDLREGVDPDRVADRLAARGAVIVHATEAEAVAAIAAAVVAHGGREDGLAVTVATNDDAVKVNQAVRDLRVVAGQVDDTRTTVGMEGATIGVGDRIVTRRNDTARNVANREAWTVEAVTDDGTVVARGSGDRHVRLDRGYLAGSVQLGYAVTDYGNQGVTVDRSVTWVTDATTAGGLYVGATRGRYANDLHVVADDVEAACQRLVAGMGRDRADRGLDVARSRAETEAAAVTVTHADQKREQGDGRRPVDLAGWRTVAELDAAAHALEVRYAQQMRLLQDRPIMGDQVRERDNQVDQAAAVAARWQAGWHRGEADRIRAGRAQLVAQVGVDYYQARDDARIIDAGPGRFGRKADQVQQAHARRAETAQRWGDDQLPHSQWADGSVDAAATRSADRIINTGVRHHNSEAGREEQAAAGLERQVNSRDRDHQAAMAINERNTPKREALIAAVAANRAALAHNRAVRAELAQTMTPQQVTAADHARNALLNEQAIQRQLARQQQVEQARRALQHEHLTPHIDRDGPSLGL